MLYSSWCVPVGLFWYGWTAETHQHWILPIIGTIFVGIGLLGTFMPIQTYLVDAVSNRTIIFQRSISYHFTIPVDDFRLFLAPYFTNSWSGWLVYNLCCFCHCCKHDSQVAPRCLAAIGWCTTLQKARRWLGKQSIRIYSSGIDANSLDFQQVRRKDKIAIQGLEAWVIQ